MSARRVPSGEMRFAGTARVCVSLFEHLYHRSIFFLYLLGSVNITSANDSVGIAGLFSFTVPVPAALMLAEHDTLSVKQDTLVCLIAFYCVSSWPRGQRALAVFCALQRGLTFAIRQAHLSAKPEAAIGRPATPLQPQPQFNPGPALPSGPTEP